MTILTRRVGLALALAVLGPTQAQAVLITGFAQGAITFNQSGIDRPGGQVYFFTPGEGLFLTYSFDTANSRPMGGFGPDEERYFVPSSFQLATEGGYNGRGQSSGLSFGEARVRNGLSDSFVLQIGNSLGNIELIFFDPTGTALSSTALPTLAEIGRFTRASVMFNREFQFGVESFRGSVTPVADASTFPIPEPSTFALAVIGLGILGLGYARRHRERTTA